MLTPAFLLLATMLALPVVNGDGTVVAFTVGAFLLGAVLYPALQHARRKGWCEFQGATPEEFKVRGGGGARFVRELCFVGEGRPHLTTACRVPRIPRCRSACTRCTPPVTAWMHQRRHYLRRHE